MTWDDATEEVTRKDVGETHKALPIRTLGWHLLEDEKGISIATFVPHAMVKEIKRYKLVEIKPKVPSPV